MRVGPFDVISQEVQRLDDIQLRNVLQSLLEAEARQHGIPLSAIRVGGNQSAADGGVDARIEWEGDPEHTDWLPRRLTIFQSKAESMPKGKLDGELAPNGSPRPFFAELASKAGAYIIFSTDDCTEAMYLERISAMQGVVASLPNAERIAFEFYDASRIARWVNCYTGVANQVRDMAGRPMVGWRQFENWSAPGLPTEHAYLLDEKPKVTFSDRSSDSVSIVDALNLVREELKAPGRVVRLVGGSGVGKTRFAQALFDERIGQEALNSGRVVYGDLGQSPATIASQVGEQLVHARRPVILVVDNCTGDTHRALTSIVQRPGTAVSLLTIDFDVGPDQPESTQVVRLYENGDRLIETLLQTRVNSLSPLDRLRVVEFAGGNARMALAVATNQDASGSLANLSDRQLIHRLLLEGRRPTDRTLRRCAEVASLVNAFHLDPENTQAAEHPVLAVLAEVSAGRMYEAVAELVERGAAQKRGTQRAILPQALAIKLAIQALERLPPEAVLGNFSQPGRERLFRSFTRRLGDLHQSDPARRIAELLLVPDGQLSDPATFGSYDVALFEHLAPVAPEAALAALERAVSGAHRQDFISLEHPHRWTFATLARKLAYNPAHFERAARVLLAFVKNEPEDHKRYPVRSHFLELFWLALSWTQATPEQRYGSLDQLLAHGDDTEKRLAVAALRHALDAGSRSSSHDGRFGSRPMGQEWRPKTYAEQDDWFRAALNRLVSISRQGGELANAARSAIADEIRELVRVGLVNDLVTAADAIQAQGFWPAGWKHVCEALHFDGKDWPVETQAKVRQLEQELRPISVADRFSAFVSSDPWGLYSVDSKSEDGPRQDTFACAEQVGEDVARMPDLWPSLVRDACAHRAPNNCHAFGRGLAKGTGDAREMWLELVSVFKQEPRETRNVAVLGGFLHTTSTKASDDVQKWLDEAVSDDALGVHIVELSISLPIDRRSIVRLTSALRVGKAPIQTYGLLQGGRATKETPPDALAEFLRLLAATGSAGAITAAQILSMYFYGHEDSSTIDQTLLAFGRDLLQLRHLYRNIPGNDAYRLAQIAERCLAGSEHEQVVRQVFELLIEVAKSSYAIPWNIEPLTKTLGELHPRIVIDAVLASEKSASVIGESVFGRTNDEPEKNATASLSDQVGVIMDWVAEKTATRAVRAARYVRYCRADDQGSLSWTPIALRLIELPRVGPSVLNAFESRFGVGSGWGPWSNRFIRRRPLLETLTNHADPGIRSWASNALAKLSAEIISLVEGDRISDERFE